MAVAFLVESYKSILERRSYVSCIIFIELFVRPVCLIWNCKCRCSRASLSRWTVLRVVYDIVWFCSGKGSEFRSPSYDCSSSSKLWSSLLLFAMLSGFLETAVRNTILTSGRAKESIPYDNPGCRLWW